LKAFKTHEIYSYSSPKRNVKSLFDTEEQTVTPFDIVVAAAVVIIASQKNMSDLVLFDVSSLCWPS
jgi:hypothetical protein